MRNWYKILCFVLVVVMSFSLVACCVENDDTQNDVASTQNGTTLGDKTEQTNGAQSTNKDPIFTDATQYDSVTSAVNMESSVDSFTLLETAYAETAKFVYNVCYLTTSQKWCNICKQTTYLESCPSGRRCSTRNAVFSSKRT